MECFVYALAIFALCIAASECRQGLYPNVPLPHSEIPEFTQPDNLFIYNWPAQDQMLCPGTVTALDYCYQISTTNGRNTGDRMIFNLLLLNSTYGIIQTISVTNTTTPASCPNRGGIITCCNRQQLRQEQQFQVPGSRVRAFGIFSRTGVDTILAYRVPSTVRSVNGYQLAAHAVIDNVNDQVNVPPNQYPIQYRMFNFVIDNSPTTPVLTDPNSPTTPEIVDPNSPTTPEITDPNSPTTPEITDLNSPTTPDITDPNSPTTKKSTESDMTTEPLIIIPTDIIEAALSATPTTEIAVGIIVVILMTVIVAMSVCLFFKVRAMKSRAKTDVATVESGRNSQMTSESIREGTDVNANANGPMEPPNYSEPNSEYCTSQERLFSD